jgi:Family of unknown function (DUF6788)
LGRPHKLPTLRKGYDPSRDRKALDDLCKEISAIVALFAAPSPVLRGTISTIKRRCGKPSCRCAQGEPHATLVFLERTQAGRRARKVTGKEALGLRRPCSHYRKLFRARARLVKLTAELRWSIDRLWVARLSTGERFFRHRGKKP